MPGRCAYLIHTEFDGVAKLLLLLQLIQVLLPGTACHWQLDDLATRVHIKPALQGLLNQCPGRQPALQTTEKRWEGISCSILHQSTDSTGFCTVCKAAAHLTTCLENAATGHSTSECLKSRPLESGRGSLPIQGCLVRQSALQAMKKVRSEDAPLLPLGCLAVREGQGGHLVTNKDMHSALHGSCSAS